MTKGRYGRHIRGYANGHSYSIALWINRVELECFIGRLLYSKWCLFGRGMRSSHAAARACGLREAVRKDFISEFRVDPLMRNGHYTSPSLPPTIPVVGEGPLVLATNDVSVPPIRSWTKQRICTVQMPDNRPQIRPFSLKAHNPLVESLESIVVVGA